MKGSPRADSFDDTSDDTLSRTVVLFLAAQCNVDIAQTLDKQWPWRGGATLRDFLQLSRNTT